MKKLAAAIVGVLLAGAVALSVYNQSTRRETTGQKLAEALRAAKFGDRLRPAPPVGVLPRGERKGSFELAVGEDLFAIEQSVDRVEVDGKKTEDMETPATIMDASPISPGQNGVLLALFGQTLEVSHSVRRVAIAGQATELRIKGDGYRATLKHGGGVIHDMLATGAAGDAALAQALLGDAAAMVATQRAALAALDEKTLLEAMLGADVAVLAQDDDPPSAVRRAMLLMGRSKPVQMAWERVPVYVLTEKDGEKPPIIRIFVFNPDGAVNWSGEIRADENAGERMFGVIDGLLH